MDGVPTYWLAVAFLAIGLMVSIYAGRDRS